MLIVTPPFRPCAAELRVSFSEDGAHWVSEFRSLYRVLHNPMHRCGCGPSPFRAHHPFPLCLETQRGFLDSWQRGRVDWVVRRNLGREVYEAEPGAIGLKELFSHQGGSDCATPLFTLSRSTQLSDSQATGKKTCYSSQHGAVLQVKGDLSCPMPTVCSFLLGLYLKTHKQISSSRQSALKQFKIPHGLPTRVQIRT